MEIIRWIHIVSGAVVGLSGLLQILLPKGGNRHRLLGHAYFMGWMLVVPTGAALGSWVIALFGMLGWYTAYIGYRIGMRRALSLAVGDRVIVALATLAGMGTLGTGIYFLVGTPSQGLGVLATFFGSIFTVITLRDLRTYVLRKVEPDPNRMPWAWVNGHYVRMYISYIAAMTAFSAIQGLLPVELLNWIAPSVIGTLLIIVSGRYFQKKWK